ncbi:MAG: tetratricopeptide repeat protein, partial [Actinobacteria bacterium]|nr:tetratricopeptide repeat protein [Actinomycetota bacterium]
TPLTEALVEEYGAQRGAEELTAVLDLILEAVLHELHERDGAVIYFSGDAVTCWLDGDDGLRATACGLAMQEAITRVGRVSTPQGRVVTLAMKVAVAVGAARRFVVGDPDIQLIDVLAGDLMDVLAAAEGVAEPGDVVLDRTALDAVGDRVELTGPVDPDDGHACARAVLVEVPTTSDPFPSIRLADEVVRPWLLPPVYERMMSGRGEFLAELRPAIPLFIRFGGLDFDRDPGAPAALDRFVVAAQRILAGYGGNTLQITVGDKGAYLYGVFGSPVAHEDDAARACAAALDVLGLEEAGSVSGLQIGIGSGRVRSGTCGHPQRRTFTCLGDAVNLSARLMSKAPAGAIFVSAVVRDAAGDRFRFDPLPDLQLKGKALAVPAARLVGAAGIRPTVRHDGSPLLGRDDELAVLDERVTRALAGHGGIVGVTSAAGLGKTRLLAALAERCAARDVRVLVGAAQPYGAVTAYAAWRTVAQGLLGAEADLGAEEITRLLEQALPADLLPRLPLLGLLFGVGLPDNELTGSLDAKLRKASLEDLAVRLVSAASAAGPLVLVLEDAHLLDPLSQELLVALARALPGLPVAVVVAYRPTEESPLAHLADLTTTEEIVLGPLTESVAAELARHRLRELGGAEVRADAVVDLVVQRAEGSPLYVRELCAFVHEQGVDLADAAVAPRLDLPTSLHSLVLSRIDRLAEQPRRTAKVASVVGRRFAPLVVSHSYPDLGEVSLVLRALHELADHDIAHEEEPEWSFANAVVRDVSYESLPFALRSQLHDQIGLSLESGVAGDPERLLDELAHHFWHGEDDDRKRRYLLAAGVAAQAAYANGTALDWFERLLSLLEEPEQPPVLVRIGKVRELTGDWAAAEQAYARARDLSRASGESGAAAWASTWWAEVARKQGRYDDAGQGLTAAGEEFAALGDDAGAGQVLHFAGTLAAQTGDFAAAVAAYEQSLELRVRLGDRSNQAAVLSNLAIVAEYQGDYALAGDLGEQALALRRSTGERWGVGISQNNLGMLAVLRGELDEALVRFEESMRLHRECGDVWMVALGDNNLGNVRRDRGEHELAGQHYRAALATYRSHQDDWALAILYEDVAGLAARLPVVDAESAALLVGASDTVRERLGSPRTPDVQEQVSGVLERARSGAGLGSDDVDSALDRGRSLGPEAADALVTAVCGG